MDGPERPGRVYAITPILILVFSHIHGRNNDRAGEPRWICGVWFPKHAVARVLPVDEALERAGRRHGEGVTNTNWPPVRRRFLTQDDAPTLGLKMKQIGGIGDGLGRRGAWPKVRARFVIGGATRLAGTDWIFCCGPVLFRCLNLKTLFSSNFSPHATLLQARRCLFSPIQPARPQAASLVWRRRRVLALGRCISRWYVIPVPASPSAVCCSAPVFVVAAPSAVSASLRPAVLLAGVCAAFTADSAPPGSCAPIPAGSTASASAFSITQVGPRCALPCFVQGSACGSGGFKSSRRRSMARRTEAAPSLGKMSHTRVSDSGGEKDKDLPGLGHISRYRLRARLGQASASDTCGQRLSNR